jgi:hypothetical protein
MIKRLDLLKILQDTLLIYAVNSALDDAVNDSARNVGNCFVLTRLVPASEGFIAVYKRLHGQNSVYNTKHMFLRLATSICNIFRYFEYLADSSVSIVTRIRSGRARNLGSVTVSGRNCSFLIASIRFLGPQKPPMQCPGNEADIPLPSSVKVKNGWICTSTRPYVFMLWCLVANTNNFSFTLTT